MQLCIDIEKMIYLWFRYRHVSMSFYYFACRKHDISVFSSGAAYSWNQVKINYILQKKKKRNISQYCGTMEWWWCGARQVLHSNKVCFAKKKVTNAEYKLPQKWRHYHKGSRQRKEGWCIFPRILAIYQKSETNFPYQIELLTLLFFYFCLFLFK